MGTLQNGRDGSDYDSDTESMAMRRERLRREETETLAARRERLKKADTTLVEIPRPAPQIVLYPPSAKSPIPSPKVPINPALLTKFGYTLATYRTDDMKAPKDSHKGLEDMSTASKDSADRKSVV